MASFEDLQVLAGTLPAVLAGPFGYRFVGLSTGTRPTTLPPIASGGGLAPASGPLPAGATFYELDTGDLYLWDGSLWHRQDPAQQPMTGLDIATAVVAVNASGASLQQQLAAEFRSLKLSTASSQFVETQDSSQGQ